MYLHSFWFVFVKNTLYISVKNKMFFFSPLPLDRSLLSFWQVTHERTTKELEQTQVKNSKLQQECEQLSSLKEHLSLENQQRTNELKVHSIHTSII